MQRNHSIFPPVCQGLYPHCPSQWDTAMRSAVCSSTVIQHHNFRLRWKSSPLSLQHDNMNHEILASRFFTSLLINLFTEIIEISTFIEGFWLLEIFPFFFSPQTVLWRLQFLQNHELDLRETLRVHDCHQACCTHPLLVATGQPKVAMKKEAGWEWRQCEFYKFKCLLATEMRNVLSLHINAHI